MGCNINHHHLRLEPVRRFQLLISNHLKIGNCCSADQSNEPPNRPANIGRPENLTLHVPRRRVDDQGIELQIVDQELTSQNIRKALEYVAQYLAGKRQSLTVVTVGGALNTILLRSRQSTHDVDFFGSHLTHGQLELIDEAMQYAERMSSIPLGGGWLNNETQLHMAPDVRNFVTQAALEQNTVVFQEPGLKLVAAPWSYCFVSKSQRLGSQYERSYDLDDAVNYLYQWNHQGNESVTPQLIREFCRRYKRPTLDAAVLGRIQDRYQLRHSRPGISR